MYGDIEVVEDILDLERNVHVQKITRLLELSNIWLSTFAPEEIINSLDEETKDAAVNFHAAYLFGLSTGRFDTELSSRTAELKDEGTRILERAINSKADIFKILKVGAV